MCHSIEIIKDTEIHKKYKEELSLEEIKQTIMKLPRFSLITFTGGEPFMREDFLEILRFASRKNKCHVITNGTIINQKIVESLIEMRPKTIFGKGLFSIGISLEGKRETHNKIVGKNGFYEKTIKNIQLIQKHKALNKTSFPLCHLTVVICRENVNELAELYTLAESLKFDFFNLVLKNPSPFYHSDNFNIVNNIDTPPPEVERIDSTVLKLQLDNVLRLSRQFRTKLRFSPLNIKPAEIIRYYNGSLNINDFICYVAWTKTGFTPYGGILCCPFYSLGNIRENGNTGFWNGNKYHHFRKKLRSRKIFPRCMGCCYSEYVKGISKNLL